MSEFASAVQTLERIVVTFGGGGEVAVRENNSTLAHVLRVLRRRWLIVAVCTILVPVAAWAYSKHQAPRYSATAQVLLNTTDLASELTGTSPSGSSQPADRLAQTEADVARVTTVARKAVALARPENVTPKQFLLDSQATVASNANLLNLTVDAPTPQAARALATAYAYAFVAYRKALDTQPVRSTSPGVSSRVQGLKAAGGSTQLVDSLEAKEQQLRTLVALQGSNASVVQSAPKATQTSPTTLKNTALGLIVGLILGVGLAFAADAIDTRPRSVRNDGYA